MHARESVNRTRHARLKIGEMNNKSTKWFFDLVKK